jgi:hypothetical protein
MQLGRNRIEALTDGVFRVAIDGDLFSQSIRQGTELSVLLEGSVRNMAVIEAIFRSAKSG